MEVEQIIKESIRKIVGEVEVNLEVPNVSEHGDYSTNIAMAMFTQQRTKNNKQNTENTKSPRFKVQSSKFDNPRDLAERLVQTLQEDKKLMQTVSDIKVAGGGFVNFYLKKEYLFKVMQKVLDKGNEYGKLDIGEGEKYLIEHTSPNPNKAMHLGHLRNNVTGMAIANIWEFAEFKVIRDDIDNNRGIAIARLMWGYLKFANKDEVVFGNHQGFNQKDMIDYWHDHQDEWYTPEEKGIRPDRFVDELYVKASADFKESKQVEDEVRQIVVDWENHEKKNWSLWGKVLDYSYQGQELTLKRFGNKWDKVWHEHEHYQEGKDIVEDGLKKGVFKKGDGGAIVTNLAKYNLPDTVVIKSDGTALYITQDLALTKLKIETFNPDKLFWVIGPEQTLALKQLFAVCEQLGIAKREDLTHIPFGWMSIKGQGKMSSRLGNVVYIDDLLDIAKESIKEMMLNSNRDFSEDEIDTISEDVGVGAVKYSILKVGRTTDTAFDLKESISLEGNSGPYLQYTYARCQSVIASANIDRHGLISAKYSDNSSFLDEINKEEMDLLRVFSQFPGIIKSCSISYAPNLLCNCLYELASKYNTFYNKHRILTDGQKSEVGGQMSDIGSQGSDDKNPKSEIRDLESEFRLALTVATSQILKNGLHLLGIKTPERM